MKIFIDSSCDQSYYAGRIANRMVAAANSIRPATAKFILGLERLLEAECKSCRLPLECARRSLPFARAQRRSYVLALISPRNPLSNRTIA